MNRAVVTEARSWQQRGEPAVWFIYTLLCPTTGVVRYVGFSTDVEKRFKRHLKNGRCIERDYPVNRWINSLFRDGLTPDCTVIEAGSGSWEGAEARWIEYFRYIEAPLLNVCDGGFFAVPAEARRRAGEKLRGRSPTRATRDKIRMAIIGRKRPDAIELGRAMAERNKGKKRVLTDALRESLKRNGLASKSNLRSFGALTAEEQAIRREEASKQMKRVWAERKAAKDAVT